KKKEKKQLAAEAKTKKAEEEQLNKEQKALQKKEEKEKKKKLKEEKKRQRAEIEMQEVVGKINPVGATIVIAFFGVVCLLILVGTKTFSYSTSVRYATAEFDEQNYREAYRSLAGVEVSESSKELKEKVRICMQLQRELDSYQNYYKMKLYLESLDALVKGIRSYDENKDKADYYEIVGQYNELEGKLAETLYNEFGVTEAQARAIIQESETQEQYTAKLEEVLESWKARNKEDER
ncbi:MAG: DUF2371 domain-containing protein, partial [Eubacterium sp.]|nr:DUF2371 domain-containing protein [Eubacterium sp.]